MAQPTIKTSFASGEWAPKLRARVDIQKYHAGAALLRNFFVDYSGGGASTRAGTRFIAQAGADGARLIPFQASTTLGYMLEFGDQYIRFFSNGAFIEDPASPGNPYQISTPYVAADLFPNPLTGNPGLKYVQDVTSLIICHPNYPPAILTINAPNDWTFQSIQFSTSIGTPTGLALTTSLGAGTFNYAYTVTAVDVNGQESAPAAPALISNLLAIAGNAGTNKLAWTAVTGALSYNVYRTAPTVGAIPIQTGVQYGFIGNVVGLSFTETTPGVAVDFSQTPPITQNPFVGSSVTKLTLTNNVDYTTVPTITIDPPTAGDPATGSVFLTAHNITIPAPQQGVTHATVTTTPVGQICTLPNGATAVIISATVIAVGPGSSWNVTGLQIIHGGTITSGNTPANPLTPTISGGWFPNANGSGATALRINLTWHIGGLLLISGGSGYTSVPNVVFSAGAATATATVGSPGIGNPGVPGFFQTRLMLAGAPQGPQSYELSQPLSFFNFNVSNPSQDDDAISGTIISEDLNDIRSLVDVPSGVVALTGHGAWLINGGGGISTAAPITPLNQTANPQAFNGANDLRPIKINLDVLYGTNKGNYVRDLTYNIYANIYTGNDITVLSNHLFFNYYMLDWAWSEEPFKTLWAVRNDGILLSLGYVKEQELIGWAHHDTDGQFLSVATVIENAGGGNIVDAVYVIVQRTIGGVPVQYVERMADRFFPYGYEDSWCVDCGLQTVPQVTVTGPQLFINGNTIVGQTIGLVDGFNGPFTAGMVGWIVRAGGGIYRITVFHNATFVDAVVVQLPTLMNPYEANQAYPISTGYTIWQPVTVVSGLTQLIGQSVVGVADGVVVGPFTVSGGGAVELLAPATKITLGLAYIAQLQTLPLDLGEPTIQGKRKKIVALSMRVADTLGLSVGTSFTNLVPMKDFTLGNIGTQSDEVVTALVNGDGRTIIDQAWQVAGSYCVQQSLPYPATVLGVMPEVAVGDSK